MDLKKQLLPWTKGPFELIRHSVNHMKIGGDSDRRLALIGFDNAVEVCIDVFMRLHPVLRGGLEIEKKDLDAVLNNFSNKIKWYEGFMQRKNVEQNPPIKDIYWYHSLRNELYHSGNGMIPEKHVVEGAYNSAVSVFTNLFGHDIAEIVNIEPIVETIQEPNHDTSSVKTFLKNYKIVHDQLYALVLEVYCDHDYANPLNRIFELWQSIVGYFSAGSSFMNMIISIEDIKNRIGENKIIQAETLYRADLNFEVLQNLITLFMALHMRDLNISDRASSKLET